MAATGEARLVSLKAAARGEGAGHGLTGARSNWSSELKVLVGLWSLLGFYPIVLCISHRIKGTEPGF
jgi:hypothetical protein